MERNTQYASERLDGGATVHRLRDAVTFLERTARPKAGGLECSSQLGEFARIGDDQANLVAFLVGLA